MTKIYNAAAVSLPLSHGMLKALIITLPKPGKDPTSPQNFRPISLLNNDLKVYAKLIAQCLTNILPLLIHPDQSEFIKGHQTTDATCRLINIIHLGKYII